MIDDASPATDAPHLLRIQRILDDALARRQRGESVSDADLIAANPDLAVELGRELSGLRLIERARRAASLRSKTGSGQGSSAASAPSQYMAGAAGVVSGDAVAGFEFPGYTVLESLSRGGQGAVYRARQHSTGRVVAIKVLLGGAHAGRDALSRFEREVHILARLRHPHIVAIHDSGVSGSGSLYYVMDFVEGQPIDRHFDRAQPPDRSAIREILAVFADVCAAVNAAHLCGVLHRDLKPGNVLISTGPDGRSVEPRILDFGLAKHLDAGDAGEATMTAGAHFIGSLHWASPEQARSAPDIDIRSDVYSLGVMLFRLLTGKLPYTLGGGAADYCRTIIEAPPTAPRQFNAAIDADLQTIVLRCLAKDRARRYQAAGELANDLRRYLVGEPIEARRDSAAYLLRHAARRYRWHLGIASTFAVFALTAAVVMAALYRGQSAERQRAEAALADAERERQKADHARAVAEATNQFLQRTLAAADIREAESPNWTVREMLDRAAAQVEPALAGQPLVAADVRRSIGLAYAGLGQFDQAEKQLSASLRLLESTAPDDHQKWIETASARVDALVNAAHYREAEVEAQAALDSTRDAFPADHPLRFRVTSVLGQAKYHQGKHQEAEALCREAVEGLRRVSPDSESLANAMTVLGNMLTTQGRPREGEPLHAEAYEIWCRASGPRTLAAAGGLANLGGTRLLLGDRDGARKALTEALALGRTLLPARHLFIALNLTKLSAIKFADGDVDGAESAMKEAAEIRREILSMEHPDTLLAYDNLAMMRSVRGDGAGCVALTRDVVRGFHKLVGPDHPKTLAAEIRLARRLHEIGEFAESNALNARAVPLLDATNGKPTAELGSAYTNWAVGEEEAGDLVLAEDLQRIALEHFEQSLPPGHISFAAPTSMLGRILLKQQRFADAEPILRTALRLRQESMPKHFLYGHSHIVLGWALDRLGRTEEAEELLCHGEEMLRASSGAASMHRAFALDALADHFDRMGCPEESALWRDRRREVDFPADNVIP